MTGYLTPDNVPNDQWFVRHIVLPADPQWCSVFDGMLLDLTFPNNWQPQGALTPQYMADWFWDHYAQFTENHVEAPEYDTPENVDGAPVQPWYEALEDWIIAGFLAVTFTPQAALVYQTTVPKLRVAFRTGDIGALFRVLINGLEVWTGDSYSTITDFLERDFDLTGYASPVTVRIEHNGAGENVPTGRAKLEYVRGDAVASMVATILRADPSGCGIQWSTDNGGQWNTIDLSACIATLADGQINQAIQDGRIAVPGGQPSGTYPPIPGVCKSYHVSLNGNGRWVLPFGLYFNDSVLISNVSGAWSDGSPAWFCPDGSSFGLGICGPGGQSHESGDVLNPGAYHMALVMQAGETWYPAPVGTAFVQQSGATPLQVMFQANDGSLSDNTGTIEFDVVVCSTQEYEWCRTFDFTQSDGGFEPPAGTGGVWVNGLGWQASLQSNGYWNVVIAQAWASANIVRVVMDGTWLTTHKAAEVRIINGASTVLTYSGALNKPWQFDTHAINITSSGLSLYVMTDSGLGFADNVIQRVTIYGNGTNPFGSSNC